MRRRKPFPGYDPTIDFNADPRCDCVHPESHHDPITGRCLNVNPTFGPCPCSAGRKAARRFVVRPAKIAIHSGRG
jgi:hypothetical protein